ncbi:hypothetical protein C8Q73DRAFT_718352 [Cubamyces lactineus]|nr:hypothetical protein C8Q73DRAFT_718352 [Cubamyces lactineus]
MSTRSLVFTSETLQLRCHSQTQNVGGARHDDTDGYDPVHLPDILFDPSLPNPWHHTSSYAIWRTILVDYSGRLLSKPTDKLVALAGLAELFERELGPGYLAGLWRYSLLSDLQWLRHDKLNYMHSTGQQRRVPQEYIAPSWSWASVDGAITHSDWDNRYYGETLAEVLNCTVKLQNENLPFGPVIGGSLVLRAMLLPCRWAGTTTYGSRYVVLEPIQRVQSFTFRTQTDALEPLRVFVDYEEDISLQDLWIVPLHQREDWELYGLLITRAEQDVFQESRKVVYRRVGLLWDRGLHSYMGKGQPPRVEIELV